MICASCQSRMPEGARFCPQCGTVVAAPAQPPRELRKTVTVLFCDMTDSTALSGSLDPESLREVMVRYYALMRDCLERRGGTVEKFIGDAVMAVFGVPVLHEDDARRALSAATEMLRAVESLNEELRMLIGVEIGVRIGVNTGEAVAAEDPSSGQVLAAGEAVNIAARLEQQAGPGQIVVGPVTRTLTERDAIFTPLGELKLKGVAERVPGWRLVRLRPATAARFPDFALPFFGRQAELKQLTLLLGEAARLSGCRMVILYGDPGVGKTRLAAEFAAKAADRGTLVGMARCQPYGEGTPLYALGESLRQVVAAARDGGASGPAPDADFGEALAYLESGLLRDGSPGELPDQLVWAAAEVLQVIGRSRPVLLVVDDLQAAKPVLRQVLGQLADRIAASAVLILGVGRPELLEEAPVRGGDRPDASLVALGPMSADESRLLVAALSGVSQHREGLAERIVERADGNPFFLEQLVGIAHQPGTDTLPPTVRSVIAARLDLLQPLEQDVLLRAAVPGARFSVPELDALLVAEPAVSEPPGQALGTLTRRRLLVPETAADSYRFSGTLVRDVAYNTLSKRSRLHYHETLADWYRGQTRGLDLVGLHLERAYRLAAELYPAGQRTARLRAEAAQALATAGVLALRHGDLHWAADLLTQASELQEDSSPDRAAVGVHLAEVRLLLGIDPRAQQTLRALAADASAAGDRRTASHAYLLLAALEMPGPSAVEDTLATVPVFEAAGDDLGLARAWLRIAQLRQLAGRYGDANEPLRRALRHALRSDTELELATIIGGIATSFWRGSVPAEAAVDGCRSLLVRYGDGRRAVRATINCPHAVLLAYRGEYGEARSLVRGSTRIINELGHAYGAAAMAVFAATIEGLAGQWDTAEGLLVSAAADSQSRGDTLSYAVASAGLARARLEQGKEGAALDVADATAAIGDPFLEADIYGVKARVLAARGDRGQAMDAARRARAAAGVTDSPACQATAELDMAHTLRVLGSHAAAAASAATAGRLFRAKGHLVGVGWAASFSRLAGPGETT